MASKFVVRSYRVPEVGNIRLKLPRVLKGPQQKHIAAVVEAAGGKRLRKRKDCQVIFFRGKRGGLTAVERCDNSKFFKSSKFKSAQRTRAKELCRTKKKLFTRCR